MPEVEAAPDATPEQLAAILKLAREQMRIHLEITRVETELKKKKEDLKKNLENDLPEALKAAGLTEMPLGEGWKVELSPFLQAAITEAKREEAHRWLEEHSLGGLVKHTITIFFGRDDDKWAAKFMRDLAQRKKPLEYERKDAVHAGTLKATIRDLIKQAREAQLDPKQEVPYELFSVYESEVAELVPPPKPKGSKL